MNIENSRDYYGCGLIVSKRAINLVADKGKILRDAHALLI